MEIKQGKCPFGKIKCLECVMYRRGLRYQEGNLKSPVPFEECAWNIMADCLEVMVMRLIGNQKATEEVRNEVASLQSFFFDLARQRQLETKGKDNIIEIEEFK